MVYHKDRVKLAVRAVRACTYVVNDVPCPDTQKLTRSQSFFIISICKNTAELDICVTHATMETEEHPIKAIQQPGKIGVL